MSCSSCQKKLDLVQLQNMSVDQIVDLYRQGYRINSTSIETLGFADISGWDYLKLGLLSWLSYKSYVTEHEIWAVIFGAFALGTAGGMYGTYKK